MCIALGRVCGGWGLVESSTPPPSGSRETNPGNWIATFLHAASVQRSMSTITHCNEVNTALKVSLRLLWQLKWKTPKNSLSDAVGGASNLMNINCSKLRRRAMPACVAFWIGSCSTFNTLRPPLGNAGPASAGSVSVQTSTRAVETQTAKPMQPDPTANRYGQPYFLPKGLIRLIITPLPFSQAGGASLSGSGITSYSTAGDTGLQPLSYSITVQRVLEPDVTAGPLMAHYDQNWLYSENISIGVTDDGLLTTGSSTSTDETSQAIMNVTQTAATLFELAASGGFGIMGGAAPDLETHLMVIPPEFVVSGTNKEVKDKYYLDNIVYNRLNIDVTFDPSDKDQLAEVKRLFSNTWKYDPRVRDVRSVLNQRKFQPNLERNPDPDDWTTFPTPASAETSQDPNDIDPTVVGGKIFLISPFQFDITSAPSKGVAPQGKGNPRNKGLWFRETTPVDIILSPNGEVFRETALKVLNWNEAVLKNKLQVDSESELMKALQDKDDVLTAAQTKEQYLIADVGNYQKIIGSFPLTSGSTTNTSTTSSLTSGTTTLTSGTMSSAIANFKVISDSLTTAEVSAHNATEGRLIAAREATVADNWRTALLGLRDAVFSPPATGQGMDFVVSLPDPTRPFAFNISRGAFVMNKQTNLTIANGMLMNVSINKPSEIEGLTEIPLNIAQALAGIPSGILTLRTQNLTAQNGIVTQQTNLVNGQTALKNAQALSGSQQTLAKLNEQTALLQSQNSATAAQATLLNSQNSLGIQQATADMNARAAYIQAQTNLLEQQKALQKEQSGQ
jgi:hypothetical protein